MTIYLSLIKCSLFIIFSAGVGRSGTFIAVDRLLKHIKEHDEVDVYSVILQMRHNRRKMVQTEVCIDSDILLMNTTDT